MTEPPVGTIVEGVYEGGDQYSLIDGTAGAIGRYRKVYIRTVDGWVQVYIRTVDGWAQVSIIHGVYLTWSQVRDRSDSIHGQSRSSCE